MKEFLTIDCHFFKRNDTYFFVYFLHHSSNKSFSFLVKEVDLELRPNNKRYDGEHALPYK